MAKPYEIPATFPTVEALLEEWEKPEFVAAIAERYAIAPQMDGETFRAFRSRCVAALAPEERE